MDPQRPDVPPTRDPEAGPSPTASEPPPATKYQHALDSAKGHITATSNEIKAAVERLDRRAAQQHSELISEQRQTHETLKELLAVMKAFLPAQQQQPAGPRPAVPATAPPASAGSGVPSRREATATIPPEQQHGNRPVQPASPTRSFLRAEEELREQAEHDAAARAVERGTQHAAAALAEPARQADRPPGTSRREHAANREEREGYRRLVAEGASSYAREEHRMRMRDEEIARASMHMAQARAAAARQPSPRELLDAMRALETPAEWSEDTVVQTVRARWPPLITLEDVTDNASRTDSIRSLFDPGTAPLLERMHNLHNLDHLRRIQYALFASPLKYEQWPARAATLFRGDFESLTNPPSGRPQIRTWPRLVFAVLARIGDTFLQDTLPPRLYRMVPAADEQPLTFVDRLFDAAKVIPENILPEEAKITLISNVLANFLPDILGVIDPRPRSLEVLHALTIRSVVARPYTRFTRSEEPSSSTIRRATGVPPADTDDVHVIGDGRCFSCSSPDHLRKDCPNVDRNAYPQLPARSINRSSAPPGRPADDRYGRSPPAFAQSQQRGQGRPIPGRYPPRPQPGQTARQQPPPRVQRVHLADDPQADAEASAPVGAGDLADTADHEVYPDNPWPTGHDDPAMEE